MILVLHYIGVVLFKCQSSQIRCKNLLAFSETLGLVSASQVPAPSGYQGQEGEMFSLSLQ